jgi:hypothetical protein
VEAVSAALDDRDDAVAREAAVALERISLKRAG